MIGPRSCAWTGDADYERRAEAAIRSGAPAPPRRRPPPPPSAHPTPEGFHRVLVKYHRAPPLPLPPRPTRPAPPPPQREAGDCQVAKAVLGVVHVQTLALAVILEENLMGPPGQAILSFLPSL